MLVLLKRCHFYSYNLSSLAPFHKSNEVNNLKGVHFFLEKTQNLSPRFNGIIRNFLSIQLNFTKFFQVKMRKKFLKYFE